MTRRVYKYPIAITDGDQDIATNGEAAVRHIAMQGDTLCAWIECEPDEPASNVTLRVHGTGHPIEDGYSWRGTTQAGPFVWHVYERNY